MNYFCCEKHRRNAVKDHPTLNGIEFLEVLDNPADAYENRQTTLFVHFIKDLVPGSLTIQNVRIEGGDRIKNIVVTEVIIGLPESPIASPPASPPDNNSQKVLVVRVNEAGDFSRYTLRIVKDNKDSDPPSGFDPVLSAVDFSFKVLCEKDFDCKPQCECEPKPVASPEINYLAKDYASFRQLILDRMAVLSPRWTERNPADLGITLVELLAYTADYLSYQQDAIATEAYLGTARKRISMRRHARLVDYFMHDGCNARTWLHVEVADGVKNLLLPKVIDDQVATRLLTKTSTALPTVFRPDSNSFEEALNERAVVFEPLHDEVLFDTHNEMKFYTWGDRECCLPKGATSATLAGDLTTLKPGQVLIFKEVKGPQTGIEADADPAHRHAVRLTNVVLKYDPLFMIEGTSPLSSPPSPGIPVTIIKWHTDDALPFPLCLSSKKDTTYFDNVSVALGNNVLIDHGMTVTDKTTSSLEPDTVSDTIIPVIASDPECFCDSIPPVSATPTYRPKLKRAPVTYAAPYGEKQMAQAASNVFTWSMRDTTPSILLYEKVREDKWFPVRDLLNSVSNTKAFVVEIESDGTAHLRFGNDISGMHPVARSKFLATYRIGNGVAGNIGREAITHIVTDNPDIQSGNETILSVTNPFPAVGGMEPETLEHVRQKAPAAFRTQERAVTWSDYENVTRSAATSIQRAACTFRWTGSWHTAFITIDRIGGEEVDEEFEKDIRQRIEPYRMAGQDVEVNGPTYVSLEVEMNVCVKPHYFASDVKASLLRIFSNRVLPDGRKGIFHPDNFTFGQPIYLSSLYGAAQAVEGVDSVQVITFKRQGDGNNEAINTGSLPLSKLEIARLDNDPNYPDHGIFTVVMKGGK